MRATAKTDDMTFFWSFSYCLQHKDSHARQDLRGYRRRRSYYSTAIVTSCNLHRDEYRGIEFQRSGHRAFTRGNQSLCERILNFTLVHNSLLNRRVWLCPPPFSEKDGWFSACFWNNNQLCLKLMLSLPTPQEQSVELFSHSSGTHLIF